MNNCIHLLLFLHTQESCFQTMIGQIVSYKFFIFIIKIFTMKTKIVLLFWLLLVPVLMMAHPPQKVLVTYDKETQTLKVQVLHQVRDVSVHFIKTLSIKVDGKEIEIPVENILRDNNSETIEIPLTNVTSGSKVKVKASCSMGGSKTGKMVIP